MEALPSPRVNSAKLPQFVGKTVRLTCKVLRFSADTATVLACDGGEVIVHLPRDSPALDTFVEVVGNVLDATTIKMLSCINMGQDIDLKLVNDTVELIHDPRFYSRMFQPAS
ncbi:replication factor A protein 3 [Cyathus striatus]|nr:replication factor A protein 3 [Cyathus striatus]